MYVDVCSATTVSLPLPIVLPFTVTAAHREAAWNSVYRIQRTIQDFCPSICTRFPDTKPSSVLDCIACVEHRFAFMLYDSFHSGSKFLVAMNVSVSDGL